ncbi:MAG: 23S rRNA (guanosine(2251)-2'-O)-methyltransferase RlmB [Candidatus Mesenet longicola]|uniref:23S rRNA (Guanosine(2251)-2'-O)-methyltransferase RlmB n=1 Tax=Candidatus Mesenet longicola TaxID=1892558 RepID=A0A8J3HW37_9RICK|nr:MAG: 23S rRNA (guanosine(2251)-2'-O)-methyltransferase RlmB [Candidatus Mesenet longicola]GHM60059.1 MAG: 23S rRNA (guanosine(2251)-2'-O)-methyltransferase RlmB [Candidatus Mesenet longicola]
MKQFWLYGKHTCISALKNEHRLCYELLLSPTFYKQNYKEIKNYIEAKNLKVIETNKFNTILAPHVNHQGIALKVAPLKNFELQEIIEKSINKSTILILDQITDTYNIGSILRTSACFGVDALILTYKHSPCENASIAKAASGTLEITPLLYVTNIVKTIKLLKEQGYWCYGLDCHTNQNLDSISKFYDKRIIIVGSEDKGLRRLVKENCDFLIKIPISPNIDSLNVSNAAAIVLYSIYNK